MGQKRAKKAKRVKGPKRLKGLKRPKEPVKALEIGRWSLTSLSIMLLLHSPGKTNKRSWLSTLDLLIKLACMVKSLIFELSSHQISEPNKQAKCENIFLAKISEMLAN